MFMIFCNNFIKKNLIQNLCPALLNKEYNENSEIRGLGVLSDEEKKEQNLFLLMR